MGLLACHPTVVPRNALDVRLGMDSQGNGQRVSESSGGPVRDEAAYVSQMCALQRFITACAGRGAYPIKFNGSLFTVPPGPTEEDPDYRRWGPGYWWQNTRLPYMSLCTSGDFDLQQPLFRLYAQEFLPLCRDRTQRYFGHGGAFYPECLMFWGAVFSETYGWTPFAWWRAPLFLTRFRRHRRLMCFESHPLHYRSALPACPRRP